MSPIENARSRNDMIDSRDATDRIDGLVADHQIDVRAIPAERVITRRPSSVHPCHHPCCAPTTPRAGSPPDERGPAPVLTVSRWQPSLLPLFRATPPSRVDLDNGLRQARRSRGKLRCWL